VERQKRLEEAGQDVKDTSLKFKLESQLQIAQVGLLLLPLHYGRLRWFLCQRLLTSMLLPFPCTCIPTHYVSETQQEAGDEKKIAEVERKLDAVDEAMAQQKERNADDKTHFWAKINARNKAKMLDAKFRASMDTLQKATDGRLRTKDVSNDVVIHTTHHIIIYPAHIIIYPHAHRTCPALFSV
jgi:hypothetical protein